MKKVSALILTGILGSSMLFAGFSGSANVDAVYNLDKQEFGFVNGKNVTVDVNVKEELGAKKGEGKIYAEINATLGLKLWNGEKGEDETNNKLVANSTKNYAPVTAKIKDAKIYGENWNLDIMGAPGAPDLASSAIEKYVDVADNAVGDYGFARKEVKKAVTYKVAYSEAPGVALTYDALTVGVGGYHKTGDTDASLYAGVKDLEVADGVKASLIAVASQKDDSTATPTQVRVVGASAKVDYTMDDMEVMVASDMGYDLAGSFDMDVAAKVKYAPVTADVYFATNPTKVDTAVTNLLSVKVATDLNDFDVPVLLTVTGKDLVNTQDLSAEAKITAVEDLALTAKAGFKLSDKSWNAGLAAEYKAEEIGTIKANLDYASAKKLLSAGVSVENTTLVDGATLSAGWYDAKDLLKKDNTEASNYGKLQATCKIAF